MERTASLLNRAMIDGLGAESVDDVFAKTPELKNFKGERADYLMRRRSVVVELKELKSPPYNELLQLVHPYAVDVGLGEGILDIQDVIRLHPRGEELRQEYNEVSTKGLRRLIEAANGQIRDTKRALRLQSAIGVVFVLNHANAMISHSHFAEAIQRQLGRSSGHRFEAVQHVAVLSPHHSVVDPGVRPNVIAFVSQPLTPAERRAADAAREIIKTMMVLANPTGHGRLLDVDPTAAAKATIAHPFGPIVLSDSPASPEQVRHQLEEYRASPPRPSLKGRESEGGA